MDTKQEGHRMMAFFVPKRLGREICQPIKTTAANWQNMTTDWRNKTMKMGTTQRSYNSVIAYAADPNFDRKSLTVDLAVDVQPGSCITSAGAAYVSGADCLLVLSHHNAGADAHIIVADRGVYIKQDTIIAVMGATAGPLAVAALTASGDIRTTTPDAE
ncbi:hypothetical protein RHD99_07795 [Buttiauxella selenatireducens]|uniref:Uncharacterized protein n=1 Tax=Buttiauxella selenatireducens TaxID=3073902 RepID=A0ABY9SIG8_9ENTR|nr:hypothetical protein [Buttiauxella sp. R73]WMY75832.1 hypothetical protein RHD99_07795 [Buttiauxella sp. R73]